MNASYLHFYFSARQGVPSGRKGPITPDVPNRGNGPYIEGIQKVTDFLNSLDYAWNIRKKMITRAVLRFETEPGRQAQVDWKECGKWVINGKEQKLYGFAMLLGYSRKPFVLFTLDMTLPTLLLAHLKAFEYFGAVPHEIYWPI